MFEIPENLPFRLAPLAWILGRWQGWGMLVGPNPDPEGEDSVPGSNDQPIIQQIEAEVLGDRVAMRIQVYAATSRLDLDPLWTAGQGLDNLEAQDLLWEETLYWSVKSPPTFLPAGTEEPRELRATGSDTRGYAALWAGVAVGPRIRLDSDALAREPDAEPIDHLSRMFGLVAGELMWANDKKIGDAEFATEYSGRLERVEKEANDD